MRPVWPKLDLGKSEKKIFYDVSKAGDDLNLELFGGGSNDKGNFCHIE